MSQLSPDTEAPDSAAPVPDLTLVKLGGSLITDKTQAETPHREAIQRLAEELAAARRSLGAGRGIILGHGSGSYGHVAARRAGLGGPSPSASEDSSESRRSLTADQRRGVSDVQRAATRLHRLVIEALAEAGAAPFALAPSSFAIAEAGELESLPTEALVRALDLGLLPVVYGDVVMDRRWGATIASTEALLLALSDSLLSHVRQRPLRHSVRRVVWAGATRGLYDTSGATIPRIDRSNFHQAWDAIGAPRGTDVTGGMALRLATAWRLAEEGIDSVLIDGREADQLRRGILAETGSEAVHGTWVTELPPL
ncbi:MAG: isopentenyl phosphate kinase [Acidobacteriota bacterium]